MASTAIYVRDFRKEIPGALSPDRSMWVFPEVKSVNAHGRDITWKIYARLFRPRGDFKPPHVPADAFITIEDSYFDSKVPLDGIYGWINVDSGVIGGKIKVTVPTIVTAGKNIGKASATNVWTQTLRNAYGIYNRQVKKARSDLSSGVTSNVSSNLSSGVTSNVSSNLSSDVPINMFPPMLAQIYKDQKVKPVIDESHPVFVQRKYNGVRTVATLAPNKQVIMYSRRKNQYPGFEYIKTELHDVLLFYWEAERQLYLDGEIYKHGEALQDISGQARREGQSNVKYNYMVYDCFIANEPDLIYSQRKTILDEIFDEFELLYTKKVETYACTDASEIEPLYNQFIDEGFEGAMIRVDTKYEYSYNERHSKALLKMKPTYDGEFLLVSWTTGGRGKAAEALMVVCQTEDGRQFPVTPAMELPDRIALAKKMREVEPNGKTHFENHWAGKKIVVEYDELSKDKVPQRARTRLVIRTWD